ncbi:MAG: biopolymer transporter ExbD [Bacteriovoracaceae bacterium]|nr:biopolymer transporter ExbD [Bacteriovoracaceae bacterium]
MRSGMFKKAGKEKKELMEIDITSLLDILVILLVFLLKSYNASDLSVDIVSNLTLPNSSSMKLGNHAVIVQVDKRGTIYVDNIEVKEAHFGGDKISGLYETLKMKKKESEKSREVSLTHSKNRSDHVNILLDQDHPYEIMQKVMHTSALAGFSKFKLIVKAQ